MKKIGLLLLPVLAMVAQPFVALAQDADPSEVFLKAYMTAQQAEKMERDNQFQPALAKLRFAGSLLEELQKSNADWQPAIVDYRSRKIAEAILRVESKISTQTDLSNANAASASAPEPETSPGAVQPNVQLGGPTTAPETQQAIQDATKDLRFRVDTLEAELKKSRFQIDSAQKEKSDLATKLEQSNAALAQAKDQLARSSQAEKEVRDQLTAAQKSLSDINTAGNGDQKEAIALKGQITQLQKALNAAQAGRSAAEKENASSRTKLASAEQEVASVSKERDDALRQLRAAGDAQNRVQVLVAQNADLQERLATATKTVRQLSADKPKRAHELHAVKAEMEKLRDQLVASQKQNQDNDKTIADLRSQLDDASGALAAAKLNGATSEETAQLVKENQMLRGIVIRERQEEARREQAKKLMLAEFDKLKIKSDVLDQQIHLLAEPITKLSNDELALLKKPMVVISDNNPSIIRAGLTMAQPTKGAAGAAKKGQTVQTTSKKVASAPPSAPASEEGGEDNDSLQSIANGTGNKIGPDVETGAKPAGVAVDLLPLARAAKSSFDRGKYKDAEKDYQEILAKSPNNLYSLSNLGVAYFRNGKLKAAELTLKKAIAIAPHDEFTHTTLGIVYYRQNKFDDALSELTKALAINPKSATAHNYLGITASQKGWQEAAEKEMLEAISDNPDYADAHFNLAVIYSTSNPPAKELARRHYEKALALGAARDKTLDKLLGM
ncbi:MAG TPA: tetratricopeptide repeat protein [Chthoniobacterales bacterium]|nr:tetratricopeptide repeat protein [Chthoniobacterales bacterium]